MIENVGRNALLTIRTPSLKFYSGVKSRPMHNGYYISHLIFVKLTIFISRLAFILKGNNNETYEYIDHEKGNDDDINKVEAGHNLPVIMNWTMIFLIRVD